jgi:transcriptional regulator with GAF, ATPase, and Fis domain
MSTLFPERIAEVFVEVADTLVDEFDVIEFLEMVTSRASELVGSSAAGLLLADEHGRLQFMAASDEQAHLVELFQVQSREGPCQDCYRLGTAVADEDLLNATDRWPSFAPKAVAAGFRSVHAFPLRLRREVIGALNLFGKEVGLIAPSDVRVLQALADVATIGLLQERAVRRGEVLTEQLQGALNTRVIVEQAKGAVAQLYQVNVDEAFQLLRTYCRRNNLRLSTVAQAIITDPGSAPNLLPS